MLSYIGVQLNYDGLCGGTVELCWVMSGYSCTMLGYVGLQLNYVWLCRGTVELCLVMSGYS